MRRARLAAVVAATTASIAPYLMRDSGLLLNTTGSVPVGLYRQTAGPAKYIAFCLPAETVRAAIRAGLKTGRGGCPGGVAPVLKTVIRPSATRPLLYSERGFEFGGAVIPNTAPKARSRNGSTLAHFAFGKYTEGAWAVSGYSPDSFDSRYFGPVAEAAIRVGAEPVFTW